ncbi:MAG TPA: hypothetical protein VFW11_12220 [Cyclobacteriaceae bacterium]|nr:hypothetical protein [Cyclobacteriaceae bacterium]
MVYLRYISIFALGLLLSSSCNDGTARRCGEDQGFQAHVIKIKYGTSFGYCVGYCWKQLVIDSDNIEFQKMSREENEPVNCERDITCTEWVPLATNIDPNDFFALAETIGCPDCADGGAEWLEIQTPTSKHKVTFEYMSPPTEISGYVTNLRELMKTFDNCN